MADNQASSDTAGSTRSFASTAHYSVTITGNRLGDGYAIEIRGEAETEEDVLNAVRAGCKSSDVVLGVTQGAKGA